MARYWCKNCDTIIELNDDLDFYGYIKICPRCETFTEDYVVKIPDYETPEQYGKRTGKEWADESPVFYREFSKRCEWGRWHVADYHNAKHYDDTSQWTVQIVIASPPVPPPDDFVPEGV